MVQAWGGIELREVVETLARNADIDLFTVDAAGRIVLASAMIGKKLGCCDEVVQGRPAAEALAFLRDVDTGESFAAALAEKVLGRGETQFWKGFHFRTARGEDRQADLIAFPVRTRGDGNDGAIVVVHDTTAEDRLRRHLDSILESIDDGVFVLNRDEEVVIFNSACERLTGLAREAVLGGRLTCDEVFRCHRFSGKQRGAEGAGVAPIPLPMVHDGGKVEVAACALFDIFRDHKEKAREEALVVSRSGERHWVETSFSPVRDGSGAIRYTVGVLRVIDDRKRAEAELQDRTRQLIHAEKMSSVGQLAAGIAHELNTPLNTILGYSQLIMKQVKDPSIVEEVRAVEAATKRCRDIVQSLLSYSRKSDGFRAPRPLGKLISRAFAFLKHDLEKRSVKYVLDLDPSPHEVVADENQLEQVILNLASNAMDAMPEGGTIRVRTERRADRLAIVFSDSGTGIPADVLPRIFEPFFTTKATGKGTGLGLSIAARIIEEHGGTIDVFTETGKGTTFQIVLPLHREAASLTRGGV
jgi:signal transduction histidine kinase